MHPSWRDTPSADGPHDLGRSVSDRIAGIVYLNSAEDATLGDRIWPLIDVKISEVEADVRSFRH